MMLPKFMLCAFRRFAVGLRNHQASAARAAPGVEITVVLAHTIRAPCRIVWTAETERRAGWAYGSLQGHRECGEEAFVVHRNDGDDVRLTVTAFRRPPLGGPVSGVEQLMDVLVPGVGSLRHAAKDYNLYVKLHRLLLALWDRLGVGPRSRAELMGAPVCRRRENSEQQTHSAHSEHDSMRNRRPRLTTEMSEADRREYLTQPAEPG